MYGNDALQALHDRWARLSVNPTDDADTARSLSYYYAEVGAGPRRVSSPRRASTWVELLLSLEQFLDRTERHPRRNSRKPREGIDPLEERLANWVRYQRRNELTLCTYQRERLECVRDFSWAPIDDTWDDQLGLLRDFVESHGHLPSRRGEVPGERRQARWLRAQVARHRRGHLEKHRADELPTVRGLPW